MGRFFRQLPLEQKPLAFTGLAAGLRALEAAWESLIVEGGYLTWTGDGKTPVLVITGTAPGAGATALRPWDIAELTKTGITLTRCFYQWGVTSIFAADKSADLTGKTGDQTISLRIDTTNKSLALAVGGSGTAWHPDLASAETSQYYLRPLWRLTRTGAGDNWRIIADLRTMPEIGMYL